MLTEKAIAYFKQKNPNVDIQTIFQDFTDEKIREAMLTKKPRVLEDLTDYLFEKTNDKEIRAHLKGHRNYLEKRKMMIEIGKKVAKNGCGKEWIADWWSSKVDLDNPLTDEELDEIMQEKGDKNV